ncbi:MAG: hypothetical protein AB7O59_15310 [Pirellulales bacterium]
MSQNRTAALESHQATSPPETADATIYPLPFNAFEYYLWADDRTQYPSVFFIRLECRGHLDREAFEQSLQLTYARHPLLTARFECDRRGWPHYFPGKAAPVEWVDEAGSCRAASGVVCEPAHRPPLHVRISREEDLNIMSFAFHHIAVDGLGGFQFIADLMVAYAHLTTGSSEPLPWYPLKPRLLANRGGHKLSDRRLKLVDLLRVARLSWSLLFQRVAVVSDHGQAPAASDGNAGPEFLVHTLSESETTALARVARNLSVRLHDLLLRDYFLMLSDWNRGTAETRRPIRVLVPTNMRRKEDYRAPAANAFGYAFVTERAKSCGDRGELLRSISNEMAYIKRVKSGIYYKATLWLMCIWPRLLHQSLSRSGAFATGVFTNLNAGFDHVPLPWREGRRAAGDLVVEAGYGAGPIRPETRVSLAVHTYAGRMSVAVLSDGQCFSPEQQRGLLAGYLDKLRVTAESGT